MKMIRALAAAGLLATGVGGSTAASAQYYGGQDYYGGGEAYYGGGYGQGGYGQGYDYREYRRSGYGYDRPRSDYGRGYGHHRDRYAYRDGWHRHDGWRGW